ncbi:hypothetical protein B7486_76625, partial [cyanobacterium TDX16]
MCTPHAAEAMAGRHRLIAVVLVVSAGPAVRVVQVVQVVQVGSTVTCTGNSTSGCRRAITV